MHVDQGVNITSEPFLRVGPGNDDAEEGDTDGASSVEGEHTEGVQTRSRSVDKDDVAGPEVQCMADNADARVLENVVSEKVGGTPYFKVGTEWEKVLPPSDLNAKAGITRRDLFDPG